MTELHPGNDGAASLLQEAMNAHRQGDLQRADELYAGALQADPGHPRALRLRGILARERDDLGASLRLLRRAVAAAPADPAPANELALTFMASGDLQRAAAALRDALARDPQSRQALANLGALLQYRGHLTAAVNLYRQALDLDPDDLEIRCNLATTLAEGGFGDEALVECAAALDRAPGHPLLLAAEGAVLTALGRHAEAIPLLEQALTRNPVDDMALINLAQARAVLGEANAAADVLVRAVRANPDNARALADLANLRAGAGHYDEGLRLCAGFLARHPGERLVLAAYAYALRDAGRGDEARALLDCDHLIRVAEPGPPAGYPGLAAFNGALTAAVLGAPSLQANPRSKSTRGGGQTGELELDGDPALAAFGRLVRHAVIDAIRYFRGAQFAGHPLMDWAADRWTLRAWGTVLGTGGHQVPHMHPLAWLSGVYYARLPADMSAAGGEAGWIEFGAPPERLQVSAAPELRSIEPREGRLVIFPGYFYHRTKPFVSAEPRVSLAFDVMPLRGN